MLNGVIANAIKEALAKATTSEELRKAITVATGFNIANLELGYRNLVPLPGEFKYFTGPNGLFRRGDASGSSIAWKVLSGRDSNKILGYVPEGKRAGAIQLTSADRTAAFATWGLEDSYTQESEAQGERLLGAGGTKELCTLNLMRQFANLEERALPFANRDLALGTPDAPTGTAAAGGALTANKYWAKVIAVTIDGNVLNSSTSLATGIATKVQAVTSPAGETYNVNGGLSAMSAASSAVDASTNNKITWSVTAIKGAVKYYWYVSTHSSSDPGDAARYLCGITYVNQFVQSADPVNTNQAISALSMSTTDYSKVATAPSGVFYQAWNEGSGYWVSSDNAVLSMTNGRVDQFMTDFLYFWNTYGISPEAIHVSGNTYAAIESLAFSSSNPRVMFVTTDAQLQNGAVIGGRIVGVINPFTGETVALLVNPNVPDSLILYSKMNYVVPGEPSAKSAEVQTFGGVWEIDWAPTTRAFYHGAYAMGGVRLHAPFCFGGRGNVKLS